MTTTRSTLKTWACTLFRWCLGHDRFFPETAGVHTAHIPIGAYPDGQPRNIHAARHLPDDGEPHWSFSMPNDAEWDFREHEIDSEIDSGVRELHHARSAIRRFLARV